MSISCTSRPSPITTGTMIVRRKRRTGARYVSGLWIRPMLLAVVVASFVTESFIGAFSPPLQKAGSKLFGVRTHTKGHFSVRAPSTVRLQNLSASLSPESEEDPGIDSISDSATNNDEDSNDVRSIVGTDVSNDPAKENGNAFSRLRKRLFGNAPMKFDKATMAKLGVSMMLSYGFVSNVSGCICVSICWFLFSKQTGLSPLAPGEWPKFLAFYAGFFAFLNVVRPARFALSLALNKYFDRLIAFFQRRFKCSRGAATFLVGFFVNFCGSWAVIAVGISIASALSGVPVWAGR